MPTLRALAAGVLRWHRNKQKALPTVFCIAVGGATRTGWRPRVCADFEAQLVEVNGEAEHVHLLINYPPKRSVSSIVNSLKLFPVGCLESNDPTSRNAIGRMSYGRRRTSPPVVAGHHSASLSNTSSNKSLRFKGPYIPALKDLGFTAPLVSSPVHRGNATTLNRVELGTLVAQSICCAR